MVFADFIVTSSYLSTCLRGSCIVPLGVDFIS